MSDRISPLWRIPFGGIVVGMSSAYYDILSCVSYIPVRVIVTQGTDADCQQAVPLIAEMTADYLLADRGYDADDIVEQAKRQGMEPVIPSRKNRKEQRDYDRHLYKIRHLVENAFLHLKQ